MSSYHGPQFEARRASQEEFEQFLFEQGIITNGSEIDIPQLYQKTDAQQEDAFVGPPAPEPNLTGSRFQEGEYGIKKAVDITRQQGYADVEGGAPWLDRLAQAFLFDEESTAKWMLNKYGKDNVFVGDDDAMYFLPPDELSKPKDDRLWVRFDPEGWDYGDVVTFVPQVIAGAAAATALAIAAPETIVGTMAVSGLAGAAGEVGTQAVGTAIGDESHVPLTERGGRMLEAGAMETAGAGVGEVVTRGIGSGYRALKRAATPEFDPAVRQARRELGERAVQDFTVGGETGSTSIQTVERMLRQNVLSQGTATRRDQEIAEKLYTQARRIIHSLARGGGRRGTKSAVAAHNLRLQHLKEIRSGLWRGWFDRAIDMVGERQVASTANLRRALRQIIRVERSHVPTADRRAILKFARESLADLPKGRTTLRELQTSLADIRVIVDDGRGLIEKLENPLQGKRIAEQMRDALKQDLNDTIQRTAAAAKPEVVDALVRGKMDASDALREVIDADAASKAGVYLSKAREEYARLSGKIREVIDNPLSEYVDDPEGLVRGILTQSDNPEDVVQIMGFLDDVSPVAANELRARIMETMLYRTGRGTGVEKAATGAADELTELVGEELSPARLSTFATRYRAQMRALLAGNPKALQRYNDFVHSAQIITESGRLQGAQTWPIMFANFATKWIGAPALLGSAVYSKATGGSIADELVALGGALFSAQALTHALFRTDLGKKYTRLFKAMHKWATDKTPSPGARKAIRQVVVDISREVAELGPDRDEDEPPLVLEPAQRKASFQPATQPDELLSPGLMSY